MTFSLSCNNRDSIGLDVGSAAIKAARVKHRSGQFFVEAVAQVMIERSGNGDEHGPHTVEAIARCLADLGQAQKGIVCGLSGPEVAVRTFGFPAIRNSEIPGAVRLEALQVCPLNLDESTLDYQLLSPISTKSIWRHKARNTISGVKGLMAVATKQAIKRKLQSVEAAGAKCALMDINGLALLNCLQACQEKTSNKTNVVLDIGWTFTIIAILLDNGLPFVRDIPYAAHNIVELVCKERRLTKEVLLQDLMKPEQGSDRDLLTGAFKTACGRLVEEVGDTIRYCSGQMSDRDGQDFHICGGLTRAKYIPDSLGALLPGEVRVLDPLSLLRHSQAVDKDRLAGLGSAFAVAVGLAMRSV